MNRRSVDARAPAVLLALGCVWGASFLFIKVIVDETTALELVAARLLIGAICIVVFVAGSGRALRLTPAALALTLPMAAISNVIPFALIAWGEEHIDSGIAAVLNSTMPIFTAVFAAAVFADERFTTMRATGLALGFLGVIALTGDDALHLTDSNVLGELAVIAAAACYAIGNVVFRTLLEGTDPVSLSALQLVAGTALAVAVMMAASGGSPDYSLSVEAWLSLLALGIGGTGVGYVAYLWLIDAMGSVRASLVTYVIPIVGLFLGWLVLDESIGVHTVLGSLLIIAGVAVVMGGRAPARMPGTRVVEAMAAE
jgi:drug/metabolite transporter (DMT)-like permease